MGDKKYQVFISSTYTDLVQAREKISKQVLTLYHFPIGMEMFSAGDDDQWTVITNTIDKSDYYVIILGHRYGSLAEDGLSYTEKEYDYAKSKGIPIMAFVKDRNVPTLPSEREGNPESVEKLERFIEKVTENKMCDFWSNEDELTSKVTAALFKAFTLNPQVGWIRANTIDTTKTLDELTKLSAENRELKAELEALKKEPISKIPNLEVSFNKKTDLIIPFKRDIEVGNLKLLSIIEDEHIPSELKELITEEEVQHYNSLVEETNEKIVEYNSKIDIYRRAQELGLECSISLYNAGTCKATNVHVDIEFPKELQIIKGGLDTLSIPNIPQLPINPIKSAQRKIGIVKKRNVFNDYSSMFGISALSDEVKISRNYTGISSNLLNFDKNNFVNVKEDDVYVYCSSIMHTRIRTFQEKFLIIPLTNGEFTIKVDIICEEYSKPTTQIITLNVSEEYIQSL